MSISLRINKISINEISILIIYSGYLHILKKGRESLSWPWLEGKQMQSKHKPSLVLIR